MIMRKKVIIMIMVAVLTALPTMGQILSEKQVSIGFQSTSVMSGSGSAYTANPVLNEDGTASYDGAEGTTRIGKIRRDPATPGTPSTPGAGGEQFPLGDAVLPLMLLICAYCCFIAFRRRGIVYKKTDKTLLNDFNAMHIVY